MAAAGLGFCPETLGQPPPQALHKAHKKGFPLPTQRAPSELKSDQAHGESQILITLGTHPFPVATIMSPFFPLEYCSAHSFYHALSLPLYEGLQQSIEFPQLIREANLGMKTPHLEAQSTESGGTKQVGLAGCYIHPPLSV